MTKVYSDERLVKDLKRVAKKLGKNRVSKAEYATHGIFNPETYYYRFGCWNNAVENAGLVPNKRTGRIAAEDLIRVTDTLRFIIFKRDNYKCVICGQSPATDPKVILHVDHIVPKAIGGNNAHSNLRTLCSRCNYGRKGVS